MLEFQKTLEQLEEKLLRCTSQKEQMERDSREQASKIESLESANRDANLELTALRQRLKEEEAKSASLAQKVQEMEATAELISRKDYVDGIIGERDLLKEEVRALRAEEENKSVVIRSLLNANRLLKQVINESIET